MSMERQTHDIGRFFWVMLPTSRDGSIFSRTGTWEQEPPWRFGPTVVVRFWPLRWALAVGWWLDSEVYDVDLYEKNRREIEEENAAYDAFCRVNGRVPREQWSRVRKEIAGLGLDYEEEMMLMQEYGVFE